MSAQIKGEWLVMDGRAAYDVDEASVMEAIGPGVRDQVPRKSARRNWADHDACLCFATKSGGLEFVERVDP